MAFIANPSWMHASAMLMAHLHMEGRVMPGGGYFRWGPLSSCHSARVYLPRLQADPREQRPDVLYKRLQVLLELLLVHAP